MAITATKRVFLARFAGTSVFEPNGDRVGKIRDVVALLQTGNRPPRVIGIVVEVPPKRKIFIPITRVSSIEVGIVVITGELNIRRFEPRTTELQVIAELLDKTVQHHHASYIVDDVAMEANSKGEWFLTRVHISAKSRVRRIRSAGKTVEWGEVSGLTEIDLNQGVAALLATIASMRPADIAGLLIDLTPKRRIELIKALDDERLASVLEEMDEALRVELLAQIEGERAAEILGEMGADDAADLLRDLGSDRATALLELMAPEDAADVRRLMSYEDYSAGGMMTSEPVILGADATVADALAAIRKSDLPPSLAASIFIARPPLQTPTGRFIGTVHLQRLLRERPSTLLGGLIDSEITPITPNSQLEETASYLANYNLLSVPIVDENQRLIGAVTIDDLLDHLLPKDWRKKASEMMEVPHEQGS